MKVFISWSGAHSKKFAEALRNWLPSVLQLVKPYFTPSDIEKGTRWNTEIAKELETSEVGILCVTRDNLHSDWVMFEAGALSKSLDKAHVCPLLFGIQNTDLAGPLKQFQTSEFDKEDFRKLLSVINGKLGENKLATKTLDTVFDKWWPELEVEVKKILEESGDTEEEPVRSERELLEEILELSRMTARTARRQTPYISLKAIKVLLTHYISLHDEQVAGEGGYQDTLDGLEKMREAIAYITRQFRVVDPQIALLVRKVDELTFKHIEKEKKQEVQEDDDLPF